MDNTGKIAAGFLLAMAILITWLITYDHGERKACSALGGAYVSGVCLDVNTIKLEK